MNLDLHLFMDRDGLWRCRASGTSCGVQTTGSFDEPEEAVIRALHLARAHSHQTERRSCGVALRRTRK